jgi:hypothetical protein
MLVLLVAAAKILAVKVGHIELACLPCFGNVPASGAHCCCSDFFAN